MNRRQFVYSGAGAAAWVTLPACVHGQGPTPGTSEGDRWTVELQGPNGYHIPKILGASGSIDSPLGFTGFDYFEWFGITHNRYFFDLAISPINPTGGVTDEASFKTATEAVRLDPLRQGTSEDVYIDWAALNAQFDTNQRYTFRRFQQLGIVPLMISTVTTSDDPLVDWGNKFMYWKLWYSYVYFFASQYGITMYEFANEPNAFHGTYTRWESHWLVCADAMRKAMADVNRRYRKDLKLFICGPTMPGAWWDYSLPDPAVDPHGWGSVSWGKVQTDLYGKTDPSIWNYGMYDYHSYNVNGVTQQSIITTLRQDIAHATNSPNSTIPIVISEYNTATGATFNAKKLDTEDITYGIGLSQILQSTAMLGPAGLGDEGGFLLFKLGAPASGALLANSTAYVSSLGNQNYGGVTRGGVCFQLYAHHFRGGKPTLGNTVTAGASDQRRLAAVWDQDNHAYYAYLSNVSGAGTTVSLDLSGLDVLSGAPVTVARVDANNTGQITDYLIVNEDKKVEFDAPNYAALLVWIPQMDAATAIHIQRPLGDTYLVVGESDLDHGSEPTIKVSLHHSMASERRIGFMQFALDRLACGDRYLLKVTGRNAGISPELREIVHIYGAGGQRWMENSLTWDEAVGVGRYHTSPTDMAQASGLGAMVDIEDNYGGITSGVGQGLGLFGKFLGPMSFSSAAWVTNYIDVTDYVKSLKELRQERVTFVIARIVRYNVNQFSNATYYTKGVYDYDGRIVEIVSKDYSDPDYHPALVVWSPSIPRRKRTNNDRRHGDQEE